jgi:hypothetical protein
VGVTAEADIEMFTDRVELHQQRNPTLTALQAGLIAAAELGIARDTGTFARVLGIAHALVLREVNSLADRELSFKVISRSRRSLKISYSFDHEAN